MEEDKKAELNLEILKKHHKKEVKDLKKIFVIIFLVFALVYIVKLLMGFFNMKKLLGILVLCYRIFSNLKVKDLNLAK